MPDRLLAIPEFHPQCELPGAAVPARLRIIAGTPIILAGNDTQAHARLALSAMLTGYTGSSVGSRKSRARRDCTALPLRLRADARTAVFTPGNDSQTHAALTLASILAQYARVFGSRSGGGGCARAGARLHASRRTAGAGGIGSRARECALDSRVVADDSLGECRSHGGGTKGITRLVCRAGGALQRRVAVRARNAARRRRAGSG